MTHYYTIDFQLGFFHKALHHHSFPAYLSHKYTFKPGASYYLLPTSFTSIARAMVGGFKRTRAIFLKRSDDDLLQLWAWTSPN